MNKKNALVMVLAMMLVCVMSVAGTIAWLQDDTETVKNTFTVGDVKFNESLNGGLDEADVDLFGEYDGEDDQYTRTTTNDYKLVPGEEYIKDPTIHLAADNEPAYVFVKVENPIEAIEAEGNTIADQMKDHGWQKLQQADGTWYENIYVYESIVHTMADDSAVESDLKDVAVKLEKVMDTVRAGSYDLPVFDTFTLKTDAALKDANGDDIYAGEQIRVKAYIIQANNFYDADEDFMVNAAAAWDAGNFDTDLTK